MKVTTILCCTVLIIFGIGATLYALTGFDLLSLVCVGNVYLYRALLSLTGVAALWLVFWLLVFRPTRPLS